jgi:hypothetical protein
MRQPRAYVRLSSTAVRLTSFNSNLDLSELPIASPGTLLSNQPKLSFLELKKADWIGRDDWLSLFGAKSRSIKTLNIISASYWNPSDLGKLQEKYRWMGVGEVNFIKSREEAIQP